MRVSTDTGRGANSEGVQNAMNLNAFEYHNSSYVSSLLITDQRVLAKNHLPLTVVACVACRGKCKIVFF